MSASCTPCSRAAGRRPVSMPITILNRAVLMIGDHPATIPQKPDFSVRKWMSETLCPVHPGGRRLSPAWMCPGWSRAFLFLHAARRLFGLDGPRHWLYFRNRCAANHPCAAESDRRFRTHLKQKLLINSTLRHGNFERRSLHKIRMMLVYPEITMADRIRLVGPNQTPGIMGVKLVGVTAGTAKSS
jgi:hypothetical protein